MMNDVEDELGENEIIETERLRQLEFRRQIDSNDPSLLHAQIGIESMEYSYIPHDGDWGKFGASIGRNTFIEEVDIDIDQVELSSFARGFASNRSVKSLTIYCEALANGSMLGALLPFFMNNPVFKSLRVEYANSTCLRALASILRQFDTLAEFALYVSEDHDDDHFDENNELYDEYNDSKDFSAAVTEVIQALAGHSSLATLRLKKVLSEGRQYRSIPMNGWESLIAMLRKSSSSLTVLELEGNPMDNLGAYILAAGLLANASLKEFALHSTHMTKDGWDAIFVALKRSTCTLEKLSISYRMRDDVLSSLSNTLLDNCMLKSLSLYGDGEYAPSADVGSMRYLIQLLHNPLCALEILDLHSVGLNNGSIMCLRNALANNSMLRELHLFRNHDVTTDGWMNFLTFPNSAKLEKLYLGYNDNINDEALDVFRNSLTNNCSLKYLVLGYFDNVTTAGWTAFSAVLRNPNSSLEKLHLTPRVNEDSYEDIAISFADALTNNKRLRELSIYCRIENFAPFSRVVCNSSSIMSTYNSNHILSELSLDYDGSRRPMPIDLASTLQINRDNSVSQAARLKIIKTHFSGSNINTTPFTVMELKVLPNAISWMGRECGISEISDLLFAFVRSMSSLCNTKSRCKKRKSVI
jgi:hypothetical protein